MTTRINLKLAGLFTTIALAALSAAVFAAGAQAATYQVLGTGGTLHVRSSPSLSAPIVGNLADGTSIDIVCQTRGDNVSGSTMWDQIDTPVAGYVADWYTNTPVTNNPSPGLPNCATRPCPSGEVGTQPNCQPKPPVECPTGETGTPPDCYPPTPSCPAGENGTPPNCVKGPAPWGHTLTRNPFAGSGQCTDGAERQFYAFTGTYIDVTRPVAGGGNARYWAQNAQAHGWTVTGTPQVDSIVVFQPGVDGVNRTYGHVAWVTAVNGSKITVTEMNASAGLGRYDNRTYTVQPSPYMTFILV